MGATVSFDLPAVSTAATDATVYAFLQGQRSHPVQLHAPGGLRLSTGLVQLLLLAAADWQARGLAFGLSGLSPGQCALMDLTGLSALISTREAAICP